MCDTFDDVCYECRGYGNDYSTDEDGEPVCSCDTCYITRMESDVDDW